MRFDESYFISNKEGSRSIKEIKQLERKYLPKILEDLSLPRGSKVLDIGCALGYFLLLCDEKGWDTYGLDVSEYAIDHAKKLTRARLYVHDANMGLPMFPSDMFDLIVMFDVIEHLDSPNLLLKEIHRTLGAKGKLIITTPNLNAVDRLVKRLVRKERNWYGFIDKSHVRLFAPLSLRSLIMKTGLKIVKLETPFHSLPRALQKIANRTNLGGQIWAIGAKQDR